MKAIPPQDYLFDRSHISYLLCWNTILMVVGLVQNVASDLPHLWPAKRSGRRQCECYDFRNIPILGKTFPSSFSSSNLSFCVALCVVWKAKHHNSLFAVSRSVSLLVSLSLSLSIPCAFH